jgi:Xaa-Pro aminopeptidase
MKTYLLEIINQLRQFSKNLDELTILKNQLWVSLDVESNNKKVYIFRNNNQLLISDNGKVNRASWEYLGNKSILIDVDNNTYLLKIEFCDEDIIALKIDSSTEYVIFINETKYDEELNTLNDINRFLNLKYFKNQSKINEIEKFYFISGCKELGPLTKKELFLKVKADKINPMCFIRRASVEGYDDGLRINEIINI